MVSKHIGGLCEGSIKEANLALLSKWRWKFKANPKALWVL